MTVGVGVGVTVGVGSGLGVAVGSADSDGVGGVSGVVGITDGKGWGGGGSEPRSAHNAVMARATTVARANHVQIGLSLAGGGVPAESGDGTGARGAVTSGSCDPTGLIGSVGSCSAMGPG